MRIEVVGLWVTYAASAAAAVALAHRLVARIPARTAVLLALLPLLFTGEAILRGRLYGPGDIYASAEPWSGLEGAGATPARNPILSDLAFANLPWRAAVREAAANGRLPLWNRFVLGGNPLLGSAQAGILHPATWLGLWLPVPLSFTFSCAFTLLLALLSGYLFFRDFGLGERGALTGAVGWGFSTYVLFWLGWSVGPSTATFPLLLLGLRRLAREPGRRAAVLTAAALWLSLAGGHPETLFHSVAAGGLYFLWELFGARRFAGRALAGAAGAGVLALLLSGPQLLPLLEAIPHSSEYRARRQALEGGRGKQSVPWGEASRRMLPDLLPFAHGIYGRSRVEDRDDGSGMPLGYSGAVLFPLAALGLAGRRPRQRGRIVFAAFLLAGLLFGSSAPGLLDVATRLPGFALALNYRLVFLAGLGLAGLAAFGIASLEAPAAARRLAAASAVTAAFIAAAFLLARPVFADRGLDTGFVRREILFELVPVLVLAGAAAAFAARPERAARAALVCLAAQRGLEMRGTYPTLPASQLAPPLPTLAILPAGSEPWRVVAAGATFRPNASALYGVEDVRGYESLVLARLADTYPLWCVPQHASFNRVDELSRPFLAFLGARWALGKPEDPTPPGWLEKARGPELTLFGNPSALPRAFVPRRLLREPDGARRLAAMGAETDFAARAWLSGAGDRELANGEAILRVRASGPDLHLAAEVSRRAFVATSLTDWPGWIAESGGRRLELETVNHAFVGFWLEPGSHSVRLAYRPRSFDFGLAAFGVGLLVLGALATFRARGP